MILSGEIERIAKQAREISRAEEMSRLAFTSIAETIRVNQQNLEHIIDQTTAVSQMTDLAHIHSTWIQSLKSTQDQAAQLPIAVKSTLGSIADQIAVSERRFSAVDGIRQSIALSELEIVRIQESVNDMKAIYGKMVESIRIYPDIAHLPRFVLPGATREVFVTGYAVNTLSASDETDAEQDSPEIQIVAEIEEETSICIPLLEDVDPDLARPYAGARDALRGENPDRARHILSSLRELWNHLLRRIAPDKEVLKWISKDDKDLLHEEKPTRRARILYVCRGLNHDPLTEFVAHDTRALVTLVEFFNRVHQLEPKLSDQQLRALLLRTDSWLTYILQIRNESQQQCQERSGRSQLQIDASRRHDSRCRSR